MEVPGVFSTFEKFTVSTGIHDTEEAFEKFTVSTGIHDTEKTFKKFTSSTGIHDTEEAHRIVQATLAYWLKKRAGWSLLDECQSSTADSSDEESGTSVFPQYLFAPKKLQMHEKPLELTDVYITLPGEKSLIGTFEAHVNGFKFTAVKGFHMVLMYANLEECFIRLADTKCSVPFMLFRLWDPIMVEKQEIKDIQFCVGPFTGDEDYFFGLWLLEANANLLKFAGEVQKTCRSKLPDVPWVQGECEFDGVSPMGGSATYVVTFSALVMLTHPCIVFPLCDIEIVNLALRQPEIIDMTVVFEDFKRGVLEIRSIPSKFLTAIKHRLNTAFVKYYVNESKVKWNVLMRDIAEDPKKFKEEGRWDSLHLEDSLTLAYYFKSHSGLDFFFTPASASKKSKVVW